MLRFLRRTLLALVLAGTVHQASAFSMLGPFAVDFSGAVWQIVRIGYNLPGDIGGPMNLGEEYRWNIRTITYGFDDSFLNYFGQQGVDDINAMFAILNNLPAASAMTPTLSEFSTDTKRVNFQAATLGLLDMKSTALAFMLEEMGLASPERYVWTLRDRVTIGTTVFYTVIKRNFDPVTLAPSSHVNGTLYTYSIFEFAPNPTFADAVEIQVDPLDFGFTAVVSAADGLFGGFLNVGEFFTGITRDDAGGLRYIYSGKGAKVNRNIENPLGDVTGSVSSPWGPPAPTPVITTTALRPGVDKIQFKFGKNDSGGLGAFLPVTNVFKDVFITGTRQQSQKVQRALVQPDIIFTAGDLGTVTGQPVLLRRSTTATWINNDPINGQQTLSGPGVISPQIVISFSTVGPFIINATPNFLDEANPNTIGPVWGSFSGNTNPPVIYPSGVSIEELESRVLSN